MAKKNEVTVEDKLRALYDLQLIDSRVDEIRNVRGELPLEVEDLEERCSLHVLKYYIVVIHSGSPTEYTTLPSTLCAVRGLLRFSSGLT